MLRNAHASSPVCTHSCRQYLLHPRAQSLHEQEGFHVPGFLHTKFLQIFKNESFRLSFPTITSLGVVPEFVYSLVCLFHCEILNHSDTEVLI